jgi:hypothetical protein
MAQSGTAEHPLTRLIITNVMNRAADLDLSRNDLARLTGRARSGLSFMDTGKRGITVGGIDQFARILGVPAWRLLVPENETTCLHCHGTPPAGYQCDYCAAHGPDPSAHPESDTAE